MLKDNLDFNLLSAQRCTPSPAPEWSESFWGASLCVHEKRCVQQRQPESEELGNLPGQVEAFNEAADSTLLSTRQCPNALRIPGTLHLSDNCLGNILQSTTIWPTFRGHLRVVETLLKNVLYRERFANFNVPDQWAKSKLKNWSASLRGLRWQSILKFTLDLLPLEKILRSLGHLVARCGAGQ